MLLLFLLLFVLLFTLCDTGLHVQAFHWMRVKKETKKKQFQWIHTRTSHKTKSE